MSATVTQNALLTAEAYQNKAAKWEERCKEAESLLRESRAILSCVEHLIHPLSSVHLIRSIGDHLDQHAATLRKT